MPEKYIVVHATFYGPLHRGSMRLGFPLYGPYNSKYQTTYIHKFYALLQNWTRVMIGKL